MSKRKSQTDPNSPSLTWRPEPTPSVYHNCTFNITIENSFNSTSNVTHNPSPSKVMKTTYDIFERRDGLVEEASPCSAPYNLFPESDQKHFGLTSSKKRPYLITCASSDGELYAGCKNCMRSECIRVELFAPMHCNKNGRKAVDFENALYDYDWAWRVGDLESARHARGRVECLRRAYCPKCEKSGYTSPKQIQCKEFYNSLRNEACRVQNGCLYSDCPERGTNASFVLQCDHTDRATKTHNLSDYCWWAANGGVPKMEEETRKGVQWICGFCHCLEPTSNQANRDDPSCMPDGCGSGTDAERAQYFAKRHAVIRWPKRQYIDMLKRKAGCCAHCKRRVVRGNEVAFHWDHLDPTTKMIGKHTLAGIHGGVAGIGGNFRVSTSLKNVKVFIDAEVAKCQLLCANCHHRKTHHYPRKS